MTLQIHVTINYKLTFCNTEHNDRYQETQDVVTGAAQEHRNPRGGGHRGLRGHRQVPAEGRDHQPQSDPGRGQDAAVRGYRGQGHHRGRGWGHCGRAGNGIMTGRDVSCV